MNDVHDAKTQLTREPEEYVPLGEVVNHLGTFGLLVRIRAARNSRLGQCVAGAGHQSRGDKQEDPAETEFRMHGFVVDVKSNVIIRTLGERDEWGAS